MEPKLCFVTLFSVVVFFINPIQAKKNHYIHWNKANPMFRLDNTDHIIDVNSGNLPWEYDQVNIICPVSKAGVKMPERHVIYSVSREEYESCRITTPNPKIVAVCSKPYQLLYFTITFRSFSPTPGGLEFHPGQDYYFISTSSPEDLHRRVGGGCSTHNMKMIFKVSDNRLDHSQINAPRDGNNFVDTNEVSFTPKTTSTTPKPILRFNSKVPNHRGGDYIYYYHPRDLMKLDGNSLSKRGRSNSEQSYNDILKNEALRFTSSSNTIYTSWVAMAISLMFLFTCRG